MFELRFDKRERIMHMKLQGFCESSEMDDFEAAIRKEMKNARQELGSFSCIIDAFDFPVQSPEIARRHHELQLDPALSFDRIALLSNNVLLNMQSARISPNGEHKAFTDRDAALAWLRS